MAPVSPAFLRREMKAMYQSLRCKAIPSLQEARGAWELEPHVPGFIMAAEQATCDAGILVDVDTVDLPADSGLRLAYILKKYKGQKVVLPFDFKSVYLSKQSHKGYYRHSGFHVHVSEDQAKTAAFYVVQNPTVPHLVAVVPRLVLHKSKYFHFVASNGEINGFPPKIWPYVVPTTHFVDAVKAILRFQKAPEEGLKNPFTRLTIHGIPPLELHTVEILQSNSQFNTGELEDEQLIQSAFERYSIRYRFARCMIKPGIADFGIVHIASGQKVYVEMKRGLMRVGKSGIIHHSNHQQLTIIDGQEYSRSTSVFTPRKCWDFLLSTTPKKSDGSAKALFCSRDSLPDEWFHYGREERRWDPSSAFMKRHYFDMSWMNMKELITGVETVLDRRLTNHQTLHAMIRRPFLTPTVEQMAVITESHEVEEEQFDVLPVVDRVGHGDLLDDSLRAQAIRKTCQERQFGWVYHLGHHSIATHVYVPVAWSSVPPLFAEIEHDTPVMPINFADINMAGELNPRFRWLAQFYPAIRHPRSSVYILFPFNVTNAGRGLDCFVVPSHSLDGNGKLKQSMDKTSVEKKRHQKEHLSLTSGEHMSVYRCPSDQIIDFLEGLCRVWSDIPETSSSSFQPPGEYGLDHLQDVIVTQRDILKSLLETSIEELPGLKSI